MEAELKVDNAKLAGMKFYNMVFLSIIMIVVYQGLKYYYADTVVAKLPFVPFSMFRKLFQAGLTTSDPTDCGMVSDTFLYMCTQMSLLLILSVWSGWSLCNRLYGTAHQFGEGVWGDKPQGERGWRAVRAAPAGVQREIRSGGTRGVIIVTCCCCSWFVKSIKNEEDL